MLHLRLCYKRCSWEIYSFDISKETVISMTQKCTTMRIFLIKSEENVYQENLQHKRFTTKAFTPHKFKEHLNRNWTQEINLILNYKKVFRALGKIDSNVYWVTLVAVTVHICNVLLYTATEIYLSKLNVNIDWCLSQDILMFKLKILIYIWQQRTSLFILLASPKQTLTLENKQGHFWNLDLLGCWKM